MIPHRLAKLFRDGAAQLDGQVRNALPGIHEVGFDECLRRTGVQATTATPAQIRRWQFARPERRFQIERGEYDTEKKEGAEHLVEQQRVLSEPSQTGVFRQHSFMDWSRIYVSARFEWDCEAFVQRLNEGVQSLQQYIVIVVAPGIAGNPTARFVVLEGQRRIGGEGPLRVVVEQADDSALNSRHRGLGIASPRIREVLHFAGVATGEPLGRPIQFRKFFRPHYAAQVESQGLRLVHNPRGISERFHPEIVPQSSESSELNEERDGVLESTSRGDQLKLRIAVPSSVNTSNTV